MAGLQERSTFQSLSEEAKNKIGNSNLSLLLEKHKPEKCETWFQFNTINGSRKYNLDKAFIPPELSEQLSLSSLGWAKEGKGELCRLLIGKPFRKNLTTTDIDESIATIEIASSAKRIPDPNLAARGGDTYTPFYVRIAGINKKLNRIFAGTWDTTENNRLTRLNISLPDSELNLNDKSNSNYLPRLSLISLMSKSIIPLAFFEKLPYFTAGLITSQMRETAKTNNHAFSLEIDSNENIFLRGSDAGPNTAAAISKLFSELGYYSKRENGLIKIGLNESLADRRNIASWEVSVPEFLQKV
jgi:hypothetical protein